MICVRWSTSQQLGWTICRRPTLLVFQIMCHRVQRVCWPSEITVMHKLLCVSITCMMCMLHLVYGTNFPLISTSLVRHSLLLFLLSHMAVHHLHYLHYHCLHFLLLAQYLILNSRLGSSANPFLLDWLHGLSDHLTILLCSTAGFVCMVC